MMWKDQLRFVRQNMKKNKSRVFMTVLATAMGCAFLIVLASVAFGLQRSIVEDITEDRVITEVTVFGKETDAGVNNSLKAEDLDYLRSVPNVKAVTHQRHIQQALHPVVDGVKETSGGSTVVLDFESEAKAGMKLSAGRLPQAPNEAVVGFQFRERYAALEEKTENGGAVQGESGKASSETPAKKQETPPAAEWIGKTVVLEAEQLFGTEKRTQSFQVTIVGVKEAPTREWMQDRDLLVTEGLLDQIEGFTETMNGEVRQPASTDDQGNQVPARNTARPASGEREYAGVTVVAESMKHVKGIAAEIRSKGYLNHSIADELKQVNMLFTIMKIGLIFVGTIAVLIASIGIYNTMTMAVTERAQDIGIMKAIGAHPSVIRRLFLIESSYIGLLGALIGTAVSYAISFAVNAALPVVIEGFMDEKVPENFMFSDIPLVLTALSMAISVGVAILSGSRPAAHATRVDVLKALRRDI